jgi:hypothetical protein
MIDSVNSNKIYDSTYHRNYFDHFIATQKLSAVLINNRTGSNHKIRVILEPEKSRFNNPFVVNRSSFGIVNLKDYAEATIKKIELLKKDQNDSPFLNVKIDFEGKISISIEPTKKYPIIDIISPFDFIIKPIPEKSKEYPKWFIDHFNPICTQMSAVAQEEGFSMEDFLKSRNTSYMASLSTRENITAIALDKVQLNRFSRPSRIPAITHHIWLTNLSAPKEIPEVFIPWIKSYEDSNSHSEGWKHYIWVQDKNTPPVSGSHLTMLKGANFEFKEIATEFGFEGLTLQSEFESCVKDRKFGQASDLLRLEILNRFGGVYVDMDSEAFNSMTPLVMECDFFASVEAFSLYVGNAIIGAKAGHEIIKQNLKLIKRNLNPLTEPDYVKNFGSIKTVAATGPISLSVAFYLYLQNNPQNIADVLFSPDPFYMNFQERYPSPDAPKYVEGRKLHPAWAAHYWLNSWTPESKLGLGSTG